MSNAQQNARFIFNGGQPKVTASGGHAFPLRAFGFWENGPYDLNKVVAGDVVPLATVVGELATTLIVANQGQEPWLGWFRGWIQPPAKQGERSAFGMIARAQTEKFSIGAGKGLPAQLVRVFYNQGQAGFDARISSDGDIKSDWQQAAGASWVAPSGGCLSVGMWSWGTDFTIPTLVWMDAEGIACRMVFDEHPEFPGMGQGPVKKELVVGRHKVLVTISNDDARDGEFFRMDIAMEDGSEFFIRPPHGDEGHGKLKTYRMSCWCRRQDGGAHYFDLVSTGRMKSPAREELLKLTETKLISSKWAEPEQQPVSDAPPTDSSAPAAPADSDATPNA